MNHLKYFLFLSFIKTFNTQTNFGDCPNVSKIFEGYAPAGNFSAGIYTEIKGSGQLQECVEKCCLSKQQCHVAFVFNKTCFHVKCENNELCLPTKREVNESILGMVLVNSIPDGPTWSELLKGIKFDNYIENDEKISNNFGYDQTFDDMFPYIKKNFQSDKRYDPLLERKLGFGRLENSPSYAFDNDELQTDDTTYSHINVKPCDQNEICDKNEECIQIDNNMKMGICKCKQGYQRNEYHKCQQSDTVKDILDSSQITKNKSELEKIESNKKTITPLAVSVTNKTVQLPDKEVSLGVYYVPDPEINRDSYKYLWTLISQPPGPINGTISDQTKQTVKLTNLSEGLYVFKVTVTGNMSYGETYANVTVIPVKRINKIPQVIITPKEQTIKLPNSKAILDGSTSIDDDKIISWHWELIQGPIGYQPKLPETNTLQLTDLILPGNYTFKLTVMDSDNAKNFTTANITVLKWTDYPPEANAGTDVILFLPHNSVTLNGTLSKDDREIIAWEWTKDANEEGKAVDMQNTRTPYLQLSNLEEGIYTFVLKVTDASNQSSTAKVHVFVKPPANTPPIANAGNNITLNLPQTWVILNGSQSTDDIRITQYHWRELSGPNIATIKNANSSVANASSLTTGNYQFELVVEDENKNKANSSVWIKVVQERNTSPIANGGGDQSVTLPVSAIYLNGSKSSDDLGIVDYQWTMDSSSMASAKIIGSSDHKPVLIITNVVAGRYVFQLTVSDDQGLTSTDSVSVIVHSDPLELNLIELTLSVEASVLTKSELDNIIQKIGLLIGDVKVTLRELKIEPKSGCAIIVFYVEKMLADGKNLIMSGIKIERILKDKFWRDASILGTSFNDIRTTICQNKCSGHGFCNFVTRSCMCETFWMPSIFYFWGIEDANCDWSILYVTIGIFMGFLLLSGIFWGISCACRKTRKPRHRQKLQKYARIGTDEVENIQFGRPTSLSDTETDSEVLYETHSRHNMTPRTNGIIKNGTKYSTTRLGHRTKT